MNRYDYTQPFWVGRNNPRFRGISSDGYLPAIEPPSEIKSLLVPVPLWAGKQWDVVSQLRAENKHLSKKLFNALNLLNTHITASKKDSYTIK